MKPPTNLEVNLYANLLDMEWKFYESACEMIVMKSQSQRYMKHFHVVIVSWTCKLWLGIQSYPIWCNAMIYNTIMEWKSSLVA